MGYAGVSTSLSLMQPYYLTNIEAPLPEAFKVVGYSWASKPVAVGSMVALTASLVWNIFKNFYFFDSMKSSGC